MPRGATETSYRGPQENAGVARTTQPMPCIRSIKPKASEQDEAFPWLTNTSGLWTSLHFEEFMPQAILQNLEAPNQALRRHTLGAPQRLQDSPINDLATEAPNQPARWPPLAQCLLADFRHLGFNLPRLYRRKPLGAFEVLLWEGSRARSRRTLSGFGLQHDGLFEIAKPTAPTELERS